MPPLPPEIERIVYICVAALLIMPPIVAGLVFVWAKHKSKDGIVWPVRHARRIYMIICWLLVAFFSYVAIQMAPDYFGPGSLQIVAFAPVSFIASLTVSLVVLGLRLQKLH